MKFRFKGKQKKELFPYGILKPGDEFEENRPDEIAALKKAVNVEIIKPQKAVKKVVKIKKESE